MATTTPRESTRARLTALSVTIVLMHLVGLGTLLFAAPGHPEILGLGVLAYTLGLQHAFGPDHIAAIDNTTRKFLQEGKKQLGVGFFFALGHSTIVALIALVLAFATNTAQESLSGFGETGGIIAIIVSGGFLWLIGILNLMVLINIYRVFRRMRFGEYDVDELEQLLMTRGFINRFAGKLFRIIKSSWQMFPLGVLFGLGFETSSQIALLSSAGTISGELPVLGIMVLPLLFACGMTLMDTADGAFMATAYGWAFSNPVRKVYYNLTVTSLSVVVALFIGTVELLQVASPILGLNSGMWAFIQNLDFGTLGYIIVAVFVATWAISYLIWKARRIEERYTQ